MSVAYRKLFTGDAHHGRNPNIVDQAMDAPVSTESLLLHQFHVFYCEVLHLKQLIQSGTWTLLADLSPDDVGEPPDTMQAVCHRLRALLQDQTLDRHHDVAYGAGLSREAQYVMAVFADEIFGHLQWEGQGAWQANLLESQFFHTHTGGEAFFDKLDRLLHSHDPVYTDVAAIYLMALALGFRGKFAGTDDEDQLNSYRRQLFAFIYRRHPALLSATTRLFPDAYAHTLTEEKAVMLPNAWTWVIALVAVVAVWCGISYGIWRHGTDDIFAVTQDILHLKGAP